MATLQNSVQISETYDLETDPSASFNEVFSNSYSHGLESIYKLENIDLKSIRKLSTQKEPVLQSTVSLQIEEWQEDQFALDLGSFYQGWMTPYIFQEPIQVLNLAKPIEKNLIALGFKNLGQLKGADLFSLKLGQGHIVDIRTKLKDYFLNKPTEKTANIDFCSLIKCIFGDKDPCKAYVLLEPYGLHQWISLTPSETMEVKRAPATQKREWKKELFSENEAKDYFTSIIEIWIKPWMYARDGIATVDELNEYLILRSLDETYARSFLELFKDTIFSSLISLKSCLALSKQFANRFRLIEMTGLSYFNQADTEFSLNHFVHLLTVELGLEWHKLTSEQIFKVLNISNYYKVYRNAKGEWRVQENLFPLT